MRNALFPQGRVSFGLPLVLTLAACFVASAQETKNAEHSQPSLPDQTYMPIVIDKSFETIFQADENQKEQVMDRQGHWSLN